MLMDTLPNNNSRSKMSLPLTPYSFNLPIYRTDYSVSSIYPSGPKFGFLTSRFQMGMCDVIRQYDGILLSFGR